MTPVVSRTLEYIHYLTPYVQPHDVSMVILTILIEMRFDTQLDGFTYLRQAIEICYHHPGIRMAAIYQKIAEGSEKEYLNIYQISAAIRDAIMIAFDTREPEVWNILFATEVWESAPVNQVFITRLGCLMELWDRSRREVFHGIE